MEDKNYVATKDVQNKIREVECAEAMEQSIKTIQLGTIYNN